MIGYIFVDTLDIDRVVAFYSELLDLLGARPCFKTDHVVG